MHTGFPDDHYFGSGKRLKVEIKKYGKENFKKEILEVLPTRNDLTQREAEIINEELLSNPLCLNLKNGGDGGGRFWNKEHHRKASSNGGKVAGPKNLKLGKEKALSRESRQKGYATQMLTDHPLTMGGKKHSAETRKQMSQSHSGKITASLEKCGLR